MCPCSSRKFWVVIVNQFLEVRRPKVALPERLKEQTPSPSPYISLINKNPNPRSYQSRPLDLTSVLLRFLPATQKSTMGKVHGSLARAGKVRGQTPKVAKQDKKKKPRGRAHKRMQYNRRFVTAGESFFLHQFPSFNYFYLLDRQYLFPICMCSRLRATLSHFAQNICNSHLRAIAACIIYTMSEIFNSVVNYLLF
nr:40S ribosomal protein S30 [Ipomoea batatas]